MCRIQDDVVKSLGLYQPRILISSFNQPNIYFEGVYIE
jgi:superfamily II DNA helicase RecQ